MTPNIAGYLRRNVLGLIAIFIALGGSAYAVGLAKNSVRSRQIKAGAVRNSDLADNAITSSKVANGSLLGADFATGQLPQGPEGNIGPTGSIGPTGATGLTGAAGATKVVRRVGAIATIHADASGGATVTCNAGEVAVGGGGVAWNGTPVDFQLYSDSPEIDVGDPLNVPTGWESDYNNVDLDNNNTGDIEVRAYVICASP